MCCRTLLDPAAREVLKPTLLELCRQSFKQLLDKEKAAQAKQVRERFAVLRSIIVHVFLSLRPRQEELRCLQSP